MIPFAVLLESQVDSVLLTRVGGVPLVLGGSVGTSAPSSSDGRARGRRTSYHWFSLGSGERPPLLPRVGVRGEGGPVTTGSRWAVGCVRPFFLGWACEGKADQLPLVLAGRGGRPRTPLQLLRSGVQVTPGTPQVVVSPLLLLGHREASMSVCPPPLHPAGKYITRRATERSHGRSQVKGTPNNNVPNESRAASPPKQALRSVLSRNPDACKNTVEKLMDTADTPQKEQPTKAFGRKPTRARCHPKK
ncbi:hypothetical protein NDU88_011460 [Pleurodeles waltl]|uniref:Uncharacterized protein n=1 Tax=Pleurodeles waltl TaxID=8319 RepID=A0AAV7QXB4_PLEWA|nr:hypothetical protein NDU88_011460 [Pleurodeles waltl]